MLPVNIAKGKCLTRSLGDLLVMAPQQSPLTTLRYSPYPLPVTAAAAATPQQLTQLATAGSFNNVMSPAVSLHRFHYYAHLGGIRVLLWNGLSNWRSAL